jgi:hypothetical protein
MTKEKFVDVITSIKKKMERGIEWISGIDIFNDTFYDNLYEFSFFHDILGLIESDISGENEGWLEYIIGCDEDFKNVIIDDDDIEINSWEDVYDFLELRRV